MVDPLSPAGVTFRPVSSSLTKVRLLILTFWVLLPALALVVAGLFWNPWLLLPAGLLAAVFLWLLWLLPRQVRALGYQASDADLLVRRGIMWRRLDVVPFGRIQFVDVQEGPLARHFGIATCALRTASASTDARIPGLPAEEASDLRELLMRRGSSDLSGL